MVFPVAATFGQVAAAIAALGTMVCGFLLLLLRWKTGSYDDFVEDVGNIVTESVREAKEDIEETIEAEFRDFKDDMRREFDHRRRD